MFLINALKTYDKIHLHHPHKKEQKNSFMEEKEKKMICVGNAILSYSNDTKF